MDGKTGGTPAKSGNGKSVQPTPPSKDKQEQKPASTPNPPSTPDKSKTGANQPSNQQNASGPISASSSVTKVDTTQTSVSQTWVPNPFDQSVLIQVKEKKDQPLYFLDPNVNLDVKDFNGRGFLHYAAEADSSHLILLYLLKKIQQKPDILTKHQQLKSSISDLGKFCEYLQKYGIPNPFAPPEEPVEKDRKNLFNLIKIVGFNYDLDSKSYSGETPLHLAAKNGSETSVRVLCLLGANSNQQDANKRTPLHVAILEKKFNITQWLVYFKADPGIVDSRGNNAAHLAVKMNSVDVLKYLSDKGVDFQSQNTAGKTPIQVASEEAQLEAFEFLLFKLQIADYNSVGGYGPIMHATYSRFRALSGFPPNPYSVSP